MEQLKVGTFIKQSRNAKGMTQLQLAEALEVSDKTISKWKMAEACQSQI